MHGDALLLELDELLLELGGLLLELDGLLLGLETDEPEELLRAELLLGGCDGVLLIELPLLSELDDGDELPDVSDEELLPGGRYPLLELRPGGAYELDDIPLLLLLLRGGCGTIGGLGPHGGAQGGAQLNGYGG